MGYLLEVYLTDYFYFYQCVGMIVTTFCEKYYSFVVSESVSDHKKFLFWGSISLEHPVIAQTLADEKVDITGKYMESHTREEKQTNSSTPRIIGTLTQLTSQSLSCLLN